MLIFLLLSFASSFGIGEPQPSQVDKMVATSILAHVRRNLMWLLLSAHVFCGRHILSVALETGAWSSGNKTSSLLMYR